jgi:hypothetical protein
MSEPAGNLGSDSWLDAKGAGFNGHNQGSETRIQAELV